MTKPKERDIILMYDVKTHRIGCVLMQSAHGYGENNGIVTRYFDTDTWITGEGAERLRPMSATLEQWKQVADISSLAAEQRKRRKK